MSQSFTFPAPHPLINANTPMHWAPKARLIHQWRHVGFRQAQAVPIWPLQGQRAHITITITFTDRRKRDAHNYYPTGKALVDGIVGDYGLLPNDTTEWLDGPDMRGGYDGKRAVPLITVTIDPLPVTTGEVGP